jgi:Kef-type K+ transport system membrane component KefB
MSSVGGTICGAVSLPLLAFLSASPAETHLILLMLIVFGSTKLLSEFAEWIHLPGVVGGLIAGILIGPSVLGWVQPDLPGDKELLFALAQLGVMFLLFRVGLEAKASELLTVGRTALLVAILGVIAPFALGWEIFRWSGHTNVESLFMGAAMVATSVGITAQVLADKGLLSHQTAKIILAAAVIDDVLGLLVLAIVASTGKGGIDIAGLAITTLVSIGFVVAVVALGSPAMIRLYPKVTRSLRSQEAEFAIAVIFLFVMALAAMYSGVAGIVGAFLAGMVLAESVGHRVHDLAHGAAELMVPFFLCSIGLHMNLDVFRNRDTIILSLVILVAAIISKWLGCGIGAYTLGMKDATRIGIGMVPRGEVGMVVAQIGKETGAVSDTAYGVAVFMAVATTIVAPPLLSYFYRDLTPDQTPEGSFRI